MAAYKVGTSPQGVKGWWAQWQLPHGLPGYTDVRDATGAEAALMEKVVWDRDTPADLDKLRELIQL